MASIRPGGRRPRRGGPVEKPRQFGKTVLRLLGYFSKEKRILAVIVVFVLVDAALMLAVPYLEGRAVDYMAGGRGKVAFSPLFAVIGLLLAVFAGDWLLTVLENRLIAGASQRIVGRLRSVLFDRIQALPIAFFDVHTHGDLMSRFTNDVDNISTTISQSTVSLLADVTGIVGAFGLMLALNVPLTAAALVTVPLVFLLSKTVTTHTAKLFSAQQAALGRLGGHVEESISGLSVVKAFGREKQVVEEFNAANNALLDVSIQAQIWSGYMMPIMNVIGNLGFAAVAGVGGILAVRGMVTVGVIASFLSYSRQFTRPLNDVANTYNSLQTAVAGAERIFEVLDTPAEPGDPPDAVELSHPRGEIAFEDVSFGYRPDVQVLSHVSFRAEAGSVVALVGPTGAGKTTVISLLNRFYDVTGGRILFDGVDVRQYTRASLRRAFGIVLQDTSLMPGTVAENIRYGRPDATDAEVRAAAETAGADHFISRMWDGYDTVIGEQSLSQGQRQLLTIARAVLADPPVLILDEATSNVDTRTEKRIQEAMVRLMRGRTCFLIAHRLSTIRDANQILVVSGGRIAEQGTHKGLLAQDGLYARLWNSQTTFG
ncbi:ABC transporter ATP-binding protein [Ethanoligenens harbinense]|nr:multidrug ABC transporter ATP-binding protein [Ethanoligenens harbinense YUAN-3]AYF40159.1 multidrug ABC transporter ATP-binding protein [Ethanoligenens harbinense]AYF43000.1 multidrug ABC transporter ATP-binding protein [Ethanoligenens harbinense]QCN93761.1 ABC transporter ATP-binding protein [Ethanoligenens harbinense]